MLTKIQPRYFYKILTAFLAGSLLLFACTQAVIPPTETLAPLSTLELPATIVPVATEPPVSDGSYNLFLDTGSVASGYQTEIVAAVTDEKNNPYWEVLPAYTLITLEGYSVSNHLMKPQIFIYPVKELVEINESAGPIVSSMQTLLKSPQEIEEMPFLPLFNAAQVLHVQLQYLDFKNGQGLRYLTMFSQGIVPVNNNELFYTYQGLTNDGKYYVSAVLPVNYPDLPVDGKISEDELNKLAGDYQGYLDNVVGELNPQAANTFTPDLTQLDAMMSTLEIK